MPEKPSSIETLNPAFSCQTRCVASVTVRRRHVFQRPSLPLTAVRHMANAPPNLRHFAQREVPVRMEKRDANPKRADCPPHPTAHLCVHRARPVPAYHPRGRERGFAARADANCWPSTTQY